MYNFKTPDLQALKALSEKNQPVSLLIKHLSQGQRSRRRMTVSRAKAIYRDLGTAYPRATVQAVFKELESLGFGITVTGRLDRVTAFAWRCDPIHAAQHVMGITQSKPSIAPVRPSIRPTTRTLPTKVAQVSHEPIKGSDELILRINGIEVACRAEDTVQLFKALSLGQSKLTGAQR